VKKEEAASGLRARIPAGIQISFLAVASVYIVALSVLGGAVLARYMLPVVPLFILICVSTVWRRLRAWKAVIAVVAAAFVGALFVNPPYGFSPEDNLGYRDYIRLHEGAAAFIQSRYPRARVLTAWPASDELSRPNLGYVARPIQVVRIEDFTAEQLLAAADEQSRFDVALVFSTKYQPPPTLFDRWRRWQIWKARYFGYHVDLGPEAAAAVLGGKLAYVERRKGQWVSVIELQKIEVARSAGIPSFRP
jgi:4-amino-4-deoxy-L-arabinose transferase-like glycosyltransferase